MSRYWMVAGAFLISAATMVALSFARFSWASLLPEACGLRNCYCEAFRAGYFVLQPVNALSNLGYVAVGAFILASSGLGKDAAGRRFTRWFGLAALITGWCSYLSHASLTRLGEWLDLLGVYQVLLLLLVYSLHRLTGNTWWPLYLVGLIAGAAQMILAPAVQQWIIIGLLSVWGATEITVRRRKSTKGKKRFTILASVLFMAGAAIWAVNGRAPVCPPGTFPWHVVWHLLSAAALGSLYLYYQSEALTTDTPVSTSLHPG